jgi:hypothetical protein
MRLEANYYLVSGKGWVFDSQLLKRRICTYWTYIATPNVSNPHFLIHKLLSVAPRPSLLVFMRAPPKSPRADQVVIAYVHYLHLNKWLVILYSKKKIGLTSILLRTVCISDNNLNPAKTRISLGIFPRVFAELCSI